METYKGNAFNDAVERDVIFVQDNHSLSSKKGTIRGLHFQSPPHAQGKLIRCTRGRIIDVAVDIRKTSPTYGQHITIELSPENAKQLWVPEGFLHGFATLEENTEVTYKVTDYYSPDCDGNVLWNDSNLNIDWGISNAEASLSGKDLTAPSFIEFDTPFQ